MHRIAILDDYVGNARALAAWSSLGLEVTTFPSALREAEAAKVLQGYSILVLMRERTTLDAGLIAALSDLRLVVFSGPTNAAIDMDALALRGVAVARTVVPPPQPTAYVAPGPGELAWALIMASARHIPHEAALVRSGGWNARNGMALRGRTLGLVGFGKIGRQVAGFARAFGMRVLAWSQNLDPAALEGTGAEAVSKDALFEQADFISVHYKLGKRSRGIVGAREIALMKPTATIVNTARGELIDEPALIDALAQARIGGAALDVFCTEPLPADHPFRTLPNVIATPHLGYATEDFMRASYQRSVEIIAAWLKDEPINLVTAEMLAASR
jgi:phosphoglycerate dehydrogenase-like enzyme